jgi:hypothetical protein
MKYLVKASVLIALIAFTSTDAFGKSWKGIVPLRSTRADVERILRRPMTAWPDRSYFNFPKEIVLVTYQAGTCNDYEGPFGLGWRVPVGTVTSIGIIPKTEMKKEKLVGGSNFAVHAAGAGFVYYLDAISGLTVETYKDRISLISYVPEKFEDNLRCPEVQTCCLDNFPTFDEYAGITFTDEKARLDNFVIQITKGLSRGLVIFYGENAGARRQQRKRAERAKNYLVRTRGLEAQRLLVVDGGYKVQPIIELRLYGLGGMDPLVSIYTEKEPSQTVPKQSPRRR